MKLNKKLSFFYYLTLLVFSTACVATSGISRISSINADGANLRNLKTYGWYQDTPMSQADFGDGFNANLDAHIKRAIEEELQSKGLQKAETNPDVMVAYDVSVSVPLEKDAPGTYLEGFGYSYAYMMGYRYNYQNANMPGYRSVDLFKQGTLIIDMIDPTTNQLIWRGWDEDGISNFNAGYKKVRGKVEEILNKFRS